MKMMMTSRNKRILPDWLQDDDAQTTNYLNRIHGDIKYTTVPTVGNLNDWKIGMVRAVNSYSGRTDTSVPEWLKRAEQHLIGFKQLEFVPLKLKRLDMKVTAMLPTLLPGPLKISINIEDNQLQMTD